MAKVTVNTVTTHDIEANGTSYILEWTHSDEGKGYIAITETFTQEELDAEENGETAGTVTFGKECYDFKEIA